MHFVFLMKKSQGECNTQPQTGAESELPQEGPFWCATLRFSLAPSARPYENVLGAALLPLLHYVTEYVREDHTSAGNS